MSAQPVGAVHDELKKAVLERDGTDEKVTFHFNPTSYSVEKAASLRPAPSPAPGGRPTVFIGSEPRTLSLNGVLFDAWESGDDVSKPIVLLMSWLNATSESAGRGQPAPPTVILQWNEPTGFKAYLSKVTASYLMFRRDGTPVRATANMSLVERLEPAPGPNPSSRGLAGYRTQTVVAGQSLQSIAHEEYGDPTAWRTIAEANGIDDPLRLAPGTRLRVPPASERTQG